MGNDALQTLGPFLAAQRGRSSRLGQGLFLASVLCVVLLLSWWAGGGDPAWGRLERFPLPEHWRWIHLLPPLALLALTRFGLPVSTSFLVLTAVAPLQLGGMLSKSLAGYGVAFLAAALVYGAFSPWLEGKQAEPVPSTKPESPSSLWLALPWLATGGLWSQWLIQDLANIYVYLPRRLTLPELLVTLVVLCGAVGLVVGLGGGPIQGRLSSKSRAEDPRSTTVISLLYSLVLLGFLGGNRLPMSTSWLFLGLLAGRELGLGWRGLGRPARASLVDLSLDLLRAGAGLATSLAVALLVAADPA